MGLMDFFRKGQEKPVQKQPDPAQNRPKTPASPTGNQSVNPPEPKGTRDYTVKSGDSLSKIAKEVYGNASDWQKIYQANKDQIKDPNMIFPGQKIKLP